MINRWIEEKLLGTLEELGVGCMAFSPLAQGMLTTKYLKGVPPDARASKNGTLSPQLLSPDNLGRINALNAIAQERGQSLAQMAISWVLRDRRVTSALIGARTVAQLDECLDAAKRLEFTPEELARIDQFATDGRVNIWSVSSNLVNEA
jgi:L-glyceraldehyde 3-phosphate reductase